MHVAFSQIVRRMLNARLLGLVLASLLTLPAFGQGTSGSLPDPISTRELEGYCNVLQMSDQQRQGIGLGHDEYLEAFRVLRDGPIAEYLKDFGGGGGLNFSSQADRSEIEKGIRMREDLINRIRSLDNRLFDRIQAVLTEDQMSRLSRAKQSRERVRFRNGMTRMAGFMNPGSRVDVSKLVGELDLLPWDLEIVDPIVASYERVLTTEVRKLFEKSSRLQLDMHDKLDAMGISRPTQGRGEGDRRNRREQMQEYFQAMQTVFGELNESLNELAEEISELNQRTTNQVAAVLSPETARTLRNNYYDRAYPSVPIGRGNAGRRLDTARKISDLNDDQHEQIDALDGRFLDDLDRITRQMVDHVKDNSPSHGLMMRFEAEGEVDEDQERFEKKFEELRDRRTALIDRTVDELNRILGEPLTLRLNERIAAAGGDDAGHNVQLGEVIISSMDVSAGPGGMQTFAVQMSGDHAVMGGGGSEEDEEVSDQYLPGPISQRDVKRYTRFLGIDTDQTDILDGLHGDYLDAFREVQDTKVRAVKKQQRSLWAFDEKSKQMTPPSEGDIKALYSLRRQALEAIQTLDESFFSDIESVLLDEPGSDAMQRVRLARKRFIYSRGRDTGGFRMYGGPGGRSMTFSIGGSGRSSEPIVDLSQIVDEVALDEPERKAIDPTLRAYEFEITGHCEKAFETQLRYDQAMDVIRAAATTVTEDGNQSFRMGGGDMRELMQGDGQLRSELQKTITELNRSTLEELGRNLPPTSMDGVRNAYYRASFPSIFDDARSAEHAVTAALSLSDLTGDQRIAIGDIAANFRASYDEVCDELVQLQLAQPIGGGRSGRPSFGGGQDFRQDQEKLRFTRNDLSDKARGRLKASLSDDQRDRLKEVLNPTTEEGGFIRIGG